MPGKTMHKSLIFGINSFENFNTFWQKKNFPRLCLTSQLRTAHQQGMFVEQINQKQACKLQATLEGCNPKL